MAVVGIGIANHTPHSIAGTITGTHHQLGTSVAIQIIKYKRCIVGAATDVDTQIDTPQQRTIQSVAVQQRGAGIAIVGIIVGIGWVPLQQYLVLSVGIHIAHTGIVGRIAERTSVGRRNAIGRLLQFDGQIAIRGIGTQLIAAVLAATTHLVGSIGSQRRFVNKKSTALSQGLRIQLLSVAVHIKGLTYGIAGKGAPAYHHLISTTDGYHATV